MAETLEPSTIRHLILEAKLAGDGPGSNFQISDIVRTVVDMAVAQKLLSSAPRVEYQHPFADKITAVIWDLIIEGVYTPGGRDADAEFLVPSSCGVWTQVLRACGANTA
jgi:hypothetical protein